MVGLVDVHWGLTDLAFEKPMAISTWGAGNVRSGLCPAAHDPGAEFCGFWELATAVKSKVFPSCGETRPKNGGTSPTHFLSFPFGVWSLFGTMERGIHQVLRLVLANPLDRKWARRRHGF